MASIPTFPRSARSSRLSAAGYLASALLIGVAITRAATSPPPPEEGHATALVARAMFKEIASDEPSMRQASAHEFPGDAWSQDDDFHHDEQTRARKIAGRHNVPLGDVMRAIDDGLRERWPVAAGVRLTPGVAPCRPRLSY